MMPKRGTKTRGKKTITDKSRILCTRSHCSENLGVETPFLPIAEFLSNEFEFIDFWLGDHLTETLWQTFFKIGKADPFTLYPLMTHGKMNDSAISAVSHGLAQIALHHPEQKNAVIAVYEKTFNHYLAGNNAASSKTRELLGLFVCDAIDAGLKELIPTTRLLYKEDMADISMAGTLAEVEKAFEDPASIWKWKVESAEEIYARVEKEWGSTSSSSYDSLPKEYYDVDPEMRTVGRNDPCPCGSGKKYKKCCMED